MTFLTRIAIKRHEVTALFKGFTQDDIDKFMKENHDLLFLAVTKEHKVVVEDFNSRERYLDKITLFPKEKRASARGEEAGNKVNPIRQQLISFLMKEGLIDKTWKFQKTRTADKKIDPKFQDFEFMADPRNRLSDNIKNIILYHGTSSQDWEKIEKAGLFPLFKGTNKEGGFDSRYKHEGNDNVLYLAGSLIKAEDYAKSRVSSLQLKAKKEGKHLSLEPVILEVKVPDPTKLVADDDIVNRVARNAAEKIWKSKSDAEKERIRADLSKENGWELRDFSTAYMLWRETDEGFKEIMKKVPSSIYKVWLASLKRESQVGYKGRIPATHITKVN